MNKESKEKPSLSPSLGIPDFRRLEKLTEIVPIKISPSLKRTLKHVTDNVSKFGRQALIEKLERIIEETS